MKQITVVGRCGKWSMPQRTVLWSTACDCSHLYFCELTGTMQESHTRKTVHSKVRFSQGLWGMIHEIIAAINKLKMKQRGAHFIDFLMYSGSFNI